MRTNLEPRLDLRVGSRLLTSVPKRSKREPSLGIIEGLQPMSKIPERHETTTAAQPDLSKILLQIFIKTRKDQYVEPQKKGTKKGVAIGFGRQKYKTALTCLYDVKSRDYNLKRMARETGNDYDVLRKWHREKLFLEQIKKNEDAFVGFFMKFIQEWHKKGWKQFQTHLKRPIKVITQSSNQYDSLGHSKELHDGLADAGFYSSSLSHKVTGPIVREPRRH